MLQYEKKNIKKEVKRKIIAGLDKNELVLLTFTAEEKNQLDWEHAKEFEYKGEMYDVVEMDMKGDTTYFWCWWDNEETTLNKQLDKLVSDTFGNHRQTKETQEKLLQFFKSLFISAPAERTPLAEITPTNTIFIQYTNYHFSVNAPPVPPPEYN